MCDDREKLIAYLYDEAGVAERRQVDAHLAECADCREELRGLRSVRQDLLSWDVPEHESVWKAFVTPRSTEWWRQVPVWGLAAAATLVFGVGLAGGFAAHALTTPVLMAQAPSQGTVPQTIAATPDQVRALEERLATLERTSSSARSAAVSTVASGGSVDQATLRRFEQMLKETEGRINERTGKRMMSISVDLYKASLRDKADLMQQISEAQAQTYGTLAKVANRGAAEKEKEQ